MKTKLLLLVLPILFSLTLNAQSPDRKWGFGIHGGIEQYNGDYGNGFYDTDQPVFGFGGIELSRNLSEHFDLMLTSTLGEIGFYENSTNSFRYSMFQANLNIKLNFFKYDRVRLRPFIFAGLGYMYMEDKRTERTFENMQLPDFGAGFTFRASPVVSFVLKETFIYSDYDKIEYEVANENDFYLQHSLGIIFNLGKAKDQDGDGIPDKKDICPDIAGLEIFNGCPDTDGDGIIDSEDACPTTAGLPAFNGCPDSDGDGIADKHDQCPDEKGLVEFMGCPDTDGDGIADKNDECPDIKGLLVFKGCPDTDGDGVMDKEDNCPAVAGLISLKGCPDRDNDGIADKDDACPDVAGIAQNKGCPEVKEEEKKVLVEALHGVNFQSGKAIITKSSYAILDNVADILTNNPAYRLIIAGHTDAQGNDQMNMKLSKDRAGAVKQYLITKGVAEERLTTNGYGETIPIEENNTAKGRQANRRVEMTIEF